MPGHWLSAKPDGLLRSGKRLTGAGRSVEDEVGDEGCICLERLDGVLVEGDPEESLHVQPVLRLPLPVVAHDAEEFGEDVREAAIVRCHVGRGFDEELFSRELVPGLVDPRDLEGGCFVGVHHGQRRKQDVDALAIGQRCSASRLYGAERIKCLRQGFFWGLPGLDQPPDDCMELTEQLGMLLGDRVLSLPSYEGAILRCGLEYLENGLSKGLIASTLSNCGPHPFGSRHLVGFLPLGPSRSRIDKALEIRTDSEEPIAQLVESRAVDSMIPQIEPKDRG